MEVKDWLALASLIVSTVALCASGYSVYLARERDRRDIEKGKPTVSITMPVCDGRGPWNVAFSLTNRSDSPVLLDSIGLDARNDGDFWLRAAPTYRTERRRWRKPITQVVHEIGKVVAPGKICSGNVYIVSRDERQLRGPVTVTFLVTAVAQNAAETRYRFRIKRIASPDKISAAT